VWHTGAIDSEVPLARGVGEGEESLFPSTSGVYLFFRPQVRTGRGLGRRGKGKKMPRPNSNAFINFALEMF
jgi:hypothetical protein